MRPPGASEPRPEDLGLSPTAPLPSGLRLRLDPSTKMLRPDVLYGGAPPRLLRLSPSGVTALDELRDGPVHSAPARVLGRRLTDAGMAHPEPGGPGPAGELTVVVPVSDRPGDLADCLSALGRATQVLVVDDGSVDPEPIARVCAAAGARLLRRPHRGGPAAARNRGLLEVRSELVAFVDSDCLVPPGWLEGLLGHFTDPLVGAVAPRVRGPDDGPPSLLDLGADPALVRPGTAVAYVPTAALVVRRSLLRGGFDEALRYGEDVDAVWRLLEAGWRIRYEPAVTVRHREPRGTLARMGRRFAYGTSAGPLSARHPGQLVHLVLSPGPTLTLAALVARRPGLAAGTFAATVALLRHRLRSFGVGAGELVGPAGRSLAVNWLGLGRFGLQFAWPLLLGLLWRPGLRGRRARRWVRLVVLALVAGPALAGGGPAGIRPVGRARRALASLAEQGAYGAGVVVGCGRARQLSPLVPRWSGWGLGQADPVDGPGRR